LKPVFFAKYNQNDQVKEDDMGTACSKNGEKSTYRILEGKSEGKAPRRSWEDNNKIVLRKI
jgi:hypothetical protein